MTPLTPTLSPDYGGEGVVLSAPSRCSFSCELGNEEKASMAVAEYERSAESPPWTAVLHDWVTTVDHKKIGIMYVLLAVVFLVVGGIEAVLLRWQLLWPRNDFLGPD